MGGQACVFYGAAEFSRDLDLLILTDPENIARFQSALDDLQAKPIAVPPFQVAHLDRGHAVHFRCGREDVSGLRIDVMSVLRGVDGFEGLWQRRTIVEVEAESLHLLGPADLVLAKKTQRAKDWPMIQRLVEQSYFHDEESNDPALLDFWLKELRTPELLLAVVQKHPEAARELALKRPAIATALQSDLEATTLALGEEQREEARKDRLYWDPLKRELEQLRRK